MNIKRRRMLGRRLYLRTLTEVGLITARATQSKQEMSFACTIDSVHESDRHLTFADSESVTFQSPRNFKVVASPSNAQEDLSLPHEHDERKRVSTIVVRARRHFSYTKIFAAKVLRVLLFPVMAVISFLGELLRVWK